jgi:uncharacterized protein (DUF2141 family)
MSRTLFATLSLMIIAGLANLPGPATASSDFQATPFPTPTALQDGRILYVVLAGDSQWLISAKFNIDIDDLRLLNNWTADQILIEGQVILLGLAQQEAPTATIEPDADVTPVGTPEEQGTSLICVLLFEDVNGNALREETEFGISGGAVSISERTGLASDSADTTDAVDTDGDPVLSCFEDIPPGEYTVSVAAPEGLNPTTEQSVTLTLNAGDAATLNFGSQISSSAQDSQLSPEEGGRSPLLGLLGIFMLFSGLALGVYTLQSARRS